MKQKSKKYEVRRQELIDIATKLFLEKGYDAVAVRDILEEVNGAQGMFYHYFKSKQEIFLEAMSQYIDKTIEDKVGILNDDSLTFIEKRNLLLRISNDNFTGYLKIFGTDQDNSVENNAHRTRILVEMLDKLHGPYAKFILQGLREGEITKETGIDESNASVYALFTIYGIWGVLHNDILNHKELRGYTIEDTLPIIKNIYYPCYNSPKSFPGRLSHER